MTLGNFLSIVKARWLMILTVLVLTTTTAAVVSILLPKKYVAMASVVMDAKPDPISSLIYPGISSPTFMNTQVDVLKSDRVTLRASKDLKLAENNELRAEWAAATGRQGNIDEWLSNLLKTNMDVTPSKDSNVLFVTYSANNPEDAAARANAIVQAYLAITLEMRVGPARNYLAYFEERTAAARRQLEEAQTKLSTFQSENQIVSTDEHLDNEIARLNELSSQLVMVQALASESSSRQTQARGASADRMQEVLNNPVVAQLRQDLSRAESRHQELLTRYGTSHPQVIESDAIVAQFRKRLDAESQRVSGGAIVANTINRQREAEIRGLLEAQRAKVVKMKAMRDSAGVLVRDVEGAQRAFESVTARMNQTSLESQNMQSNVNLLTQAVPPPKASSPRLTLNIAVALLAGTALGLGIALLSELRDRRVRMPQDVLSALQLPLLGVIPAPSERGRGDKRRFSGMEQRLLGLKSATDNERLL